MIDEGKIARAQERGAKAKTLLEDEIFQEAVRAVSDEYFNAWTNTAPNDTAGRENLWRALKSLDKIVKHLRTVVQNGKIASKDLADIKYLKR